MSQSQGTGARIAAIGIFLAAAVYLASFYIPLVAINASHQGLAATGTLSVAKLIAEREAVSRIIANPNASDSQILATVLLHGVEFKNAVPAQFAKGRAWLERFSAGADAPGTASKKRAPSQLHQKYARGLMLAGRAGITWLALLAWFALAIIINPGRGWFTYAVLLLLALGAGAAAIVSYWLTGIGIVYANQELPRVAPLAVRAMNLDTAMVRAIGSYAWFGAGIAAIVLSLICLVNKPTRALAR